jgi:hypothetical protein
MCPLCIATAAQIVASAASTGGLAAFVVQLRPKNGTKEIISESKSTEDVSWPPTETAENAEMKRQR